jgi:glycosyltransferase involved in cell wall biosynthesis
MKISLPKISVIIPTYNRAHFISSTIDSVLKQDIDDFEILLIDDGSTDNTKQIVENNYKQYLGNKLKYIYQINQERSLARNNGVALAIGKYIAFIDSDDLWYPYHLSACYNFLEYQNKFNMVFTDFDIADEKLQIIATQRVKRFNEHKILNDILLGRIVFGPSVVMIRKEIFQAVGGFDKELMPSEDGELWARIAYTYPESIGHIDKATVLMRQHTGRSIYNFKIVENAELKVLKKTTSSYIHPINVILKMKIISHGYLGIAYVAAFNNIKRITALYLFKAIFYNPFIIFYHIFSKTLIRVMFGYRITNKFKVVKMKLSNK